MTDEEAIEAAQAFSEHQQETDMQRLETRLASESRRADSAETELRETVGELEKVKASRDDQCRIARVYERQHLQCSKMYLDAWTRLTEATALLERAQHYVVPGSWFTDYQAFLSRAPAQPDAPELRGDFGIGFAAMAQPYAEDQQPAVPEPSAGQAVGFEQLWEGWRGRALDAEAQLEAVLIHAKRGLGSAWKGSTVHDELTAIVALLTPAPSPGAGEWTTPEPGPFSDIDVSKCIDPTIPDGYVRVNGKLVKWSGAGGGK